MWWRSMPRSSFDDNALYRHPKLEKLRDEAEEDPKELEAAKHALNDATLDGHVIWRASGQPRLYGASHFYSTPAVSYGRVYIGSTDGKLYSFGAASGKLRWSHSTGGYVYGSPAVSNGIVFVGSYGGRFYAFDAATGDTRWSFAANGRISGSPTVIGGDVYVATLERRTYAFAAAGGKCSGLRRRQVHAGGRRRRATPLVGCTRLYGMVPA